MNMFSVVVYNSYLTEELRRQQYTAEEQRSSNARIGKITSNKDGNLKNAVPNTANAHPFDLRKSKKPLDVDANKAKSNTHETKLPKEQLFNEDVPKAIVLPEKGTGNAQPSNLRILFYLTPGRIQLP